jgi:hypothetical protein
MENFKITVEDLAVEAARLASIARMASPRAEGGDGGRVTPVVVVVTHREGLRDSSQLTNTPFRSTPYCCVAVFQYNMQAAAKMNADAADLRCAVHVELMAAPDEFEKYAAVDAGSDASVDVVDWNAEGEEAVDYNYTKTERRTETNPDAARAKAETVGEKKEKRDEEREEEQERAEKEKEKGKGGGCTVS